MAKFKAGDRVRVIKGHEEGASGVVTNPYWQIAANDWPFVLFTDDEGNRHSADESNMVLIEDPTCEYAMGMGPERKPLGDFMNRYDVSPVWTNQSRARSLVDWYTKEYPDEEFRLIKRKKAGPIEDA